MLIYGKYNNYSLRGQNLCGMIVVQWTGGNSTNDGKGEQGHTVLGFLHYMSRTHIIIWG